MVSPLAARRIRILAILLASMAALGLLVLAVVATSNSRTCAACHSAYSESLASSSHKGVSCYTCHLSGGAWSFVEFKTSEIMFMYPGKVFGDKLDGPSARISRAACYKCHTKVDDLMVGKKGLRILHGECSPSDTKCDRCHSDVAHPKQVRWVRAPVMDDCIICHTEHDVPARNCTLCHAGKLRDRRLVSGPFRVTHGPEWRRAHGMGDLATCETCHEPSKCVRCHGTPIPHEANFTAVHGQRSKQPKATCDRCHNYESFCEKCHGFPMPHPADFRKQHMKVAINGSDPKCVKCHRQFDCDNCHLKHVHPGATDGELREVFKRWKIRP